MRGNNEDPIFPFRTNLQYFWTFSRDNPCYFDPKHTIARDKSLKDSKIMRFNRVIVARHFSLLGFSLLTQSRVFDRAVIARYFQYFV